MNAKSLKIKVGGTLFLLIVAAAISAPFISSHDPGGQNISENLKPPAFSENGSWTHPLGTDSLGRDVLSRIIYGARISILIGFATIMLSAFIGVILGGISGYYGGFIEYIIIKIVDVFLAFPFLLLAIALMAFLGPGLDNVILALVLRQWPQYTRVVRGEVLSLKEREFVIASKAAGASDFRIIFRHLLPNCMASILVIATFSMGIVILIEASLSFLGLGIPPEIPTWGVMISEGRSYIHQAWWLTLFPGLLIFLSIMGVNLLGDGLRDILDPKLKDI